MKPEEKKYLRKIGCLMLVAIFFFPSMSLTFVEDESPVLVRAEVNQASLTIGDPIEYTVTIRRAPSIQILSTISPPDSDILKIKKIEEFSSEDESWMIEGRKFFLATFRLGEFILDPIRIDYRTADGQTHSLETDPIYLTVKSVAEGEEKVDIRGVKSVLPITGHFLIFLVILAVLALLLVGWIIFNHYRKRPSKTQKQEEYISPEEEALFRLNRLFDSDLIRRGKMKEYFLTLSEILRTYFEKRYGILAIEATTSEIMFSLRSREIALELREKISDVLESSDLAKFAKWIPEPNEIVQINQKSKQIIEESKPQVSMAHNHA